MDTFDWNLNQTSGFQGTPASEPAPAARQALTAEAPASVFTQPNVGRQNSASTSQQPNQTKRPEKKRRLGGAIIALGLCCALLGGVAGASSVYLFGGSTRSGSRVQAAPTSAQPKSSGSTQIVVSNGEHQTVETISADPGSRMTASQVYEKNVGSTVGITTEVTTYNYFGYPTTGAAAGSGFILSSDGYILTNQHVIDGANSIKVAMYEGKTYQAKLIGEDASNDIAVLKIDATGLTPVTLGNSDTLKVGEDVLAIGNPLGELTFSLTKGAVSALDRSVTLSSGVTMNLIQTDCAINSGNSGGALFNLYGEVVGITNAKYSSNGYSGEASIDNIGFAIPINQIKDIVNSIIDKPYIGVTVENVGEEAVSYGLPRGAAVKSVENDSPAAKAGLIANDIITSVNGTEITGFQELSDAIRNAGVDAKLELKVYRRGETLTLTVTVGEKQQSALPEAESGSKNEQTEIPGEGELPWDGGSGSWPFGG